MGISTRGGVTNGANCRNTADAIKIKTNQNQIRFKLCNQFERAFAVVTLNEFAKAKMLNGCPRGTDVPFAVIRIQDCLFLVGMARHDGRCSLCSRVFWIGSRWQISVRGCLTEC